MTSNLNTRKLVDGYRRAFIDSSIDSDPSYSPQLVSNSNGRKVLSVIEKELKGYGDLRILVGSSNLTQDAITKNHEWNTRLVSTSDGQYAKDIESEFNDLWDSSIS